MNGTITPWTPSDQLKTMLQKQSITPTELVQSVFECFTHLLGKPEFAHPIIRQQFKKEGVSMDSPPKDGVMKVIANLEKHASSIRDREMVRISKSRLMQFVSHCGGGLAVKSIDVRDEKDIVLSRGAGLEIARAMGFSATDCNKIATSISELARNIVNYAGARGKITITPMQLGEKKGLEVIAEDQGPGIGNLQEILEGNYQSKNGLGMGIMGTKKLMDDFDIKTSEKGTWIRAVKYLR